VRSDPIPGRGTERVRTILRFEQQSLNMWRSEIMKSEAKVQPGEPAHRQGKLQQSFPLHPHRR
jgi:hypothetical protein